ncbi:MAG TPA: hypothetical protein VGK64_20335 [Bryobacteraceae bacterium]
MISPLYGVVQESDGVFSAFGRKLLATSNQLSAGGDPARSPLKAKS